MTFREQTTAANAWPFSNAAEAPAKSFVKASCVEVLAERFACQEAWEERSGFGSLNLRNQDDQKEVGAVKGFKGVSYGRSKRLLKPCEGPPSTKATHHPARGPREANATQPCFRYNLFLLHVARQQGMKPSLL